jgi:hypothetical protein
MRTLAATAAACAAVLLAGCETGPIAAVGVTPEALTSGAVAHWRFDERGGTTVGDASGHGRDGTIAGATWSWLDAGRFGGALHLEQGDAVTVDGFPNATPGWTVSLWVQIPSQAIGLGDATLISTEDVFKGGWEINVNTLSTNLLYQPGFWVGPGPYDYAHYDCQGCIHPDHWQHVAAVVDGKAATLAFYLDGVLQAREHVGQVISPGVPTLYLGRWATTDPARLLLGSLDDIGIWDRALSSAEIALLNQAPVP